MKTLAEHTLVELFECDPRRLKRARDVQRALHRAVLQGGGTIVKEVFHNFSPHGVSGVIVITESHVTIHTWPEHAYAAVDIFSCSPKLQAARIRAEIKLALGAKRTRAKTFGRGPARPLLGSRP